MKARIILHCGAPKTGSTSFQHLLYANHALLLEKGFYCPAVSRKRRLKDDVRILLEQMTKPENDNQAYRFHISEVIERLRAETGCHTLIISNENLLGKPFHGPGKRFYRDAEARAERLHLALQDYDVHVRFVIRDYAGFLPSWYVQQVRMGNTIRFDDFLRSYTLESMDWRTPVSALRRHFEPERVEIFDHADMTADPTGFLRSMFPDVMAALGDRGRDLPRKNTSIGVGMIERYRRWNELAARISPNPKWRTRIHHIGRRYALLPLERFSRSAKLVMPDDIAKSLKARYQVDREAIAPRRVQAPSGWARG